MRRAYLFITLLGLPALADTSPVATPATGTLTVSGGVNYDMYANPNSKEGEFPFELSYQVGRWTWEATDTYYIRGGEPDGLTGTKPNPKTHAGMQAIHVGNTIIWVPRPRRPKAGDPTVRGWGDMGMGVTYSAVLEGESHPGVDFTMTTTVPTGSESKGLSGGATNWAAGTALNKIVGPFTFNLAVMHAWNGQPYKLAVQDTWSSEASVVLDMQNKNTLGLDFNWSQSAAPSEPQSRTLGLDGVISLSARDRLGLTWTHGFSKADPVTQVGFVLSRTY